MKSPELFSRVGRKNSSDEPPNSLILLFATGNHDRLESLLQLDGHTVVVPSTSDQAVAVCLHNRIMAAVIDEVSLEKDGDWSLAQSIKMVSANTPVVLMFNRSVDEEPIPEGVDCLVSDKDPGQILNAIKRYLRQVEEKQAG